MTDQDPETIDDDLADAAGELILEAEQQYQQNQAEHEAFLDTVAEEEGTEVLETECNLIGEYTVPLKAKLNGELMDQMGHLDSRVERFERGEARGYEISETADEISQLLADVIDDHEWHKRKFYDAYESEGLDPLGVMLERVFEALKQERERREGTADGFRSK
jgi:hypothetical protein